MAEMSPELEQSLHAKFPRIFADLFANHVDGAAAGLHCGDGWFFLLDALCEGLQWETDHAGAPQVVVRQVKEKFGGLRFHAGVVSGEQRGMIQLATRLSERVCETCGVPAERIDGRGIATRCAAHARA